MKKEQKTSINLKVIMSLAALLCFCLALALNAFAADSATISLDTTTWRQTQNISFTCTSCENMTYLEVSFSAADTANSSSVKIFNITNGTGTNFQRGKVNYTFYAAIALEDTSSGSVTASGFNRTAGAIGSVSATTVIIDRTATSAPTSLSPTGEQDEGALTFSGTVTAGTTTGCSLVFQGTSPGYSSYPMTHSGTSCSVSLSNLGRLSYSYVIRATDGLNSTDSAIATVTVKATNSGAGQRAVRAAASSGQPTTKQGVARTLGIQTIDGSSSGTVPSLRNELTKPELTKTGIGASLGAAVGLTGFALGPLGVITVPAGAVIGGFIGALV
jgi:hypothetical protein